jgi:hypothetical protein
LVGLGSLGYLWWKAWHPGSNGWSAGGYVDMLQVVSIADVGQFVSGIAGALVFIWIIFTYHAQREELSMQREEMASQRREFEKLAEEAKSQSFLQEQTAAALTKANELAVRMEAPYVTGGGSYWREPIPEAYFPLIRSRRGEKRFRVDVSNYGKTPAYLIAFDVQFDTRAQVKGMLLPVTRTRVHYDLLPPGGAHINGIDGNREIWIPKWAEVVYGAFWYRDIWGKPHLFRFILSLDEPETLSNVDCVEGYRGHWDVDENMNILTDDSVRS